MIIMINVLSPDHQRALHNKHLYIRFKELALLVLLFTAIIGILALLGKYVLDEQLADLANRNATAITANEIATAQAQKYNQELRSIRSIQNRFHNWSEIIIRLINQPTPGIIYQNIKIDATNETVDLSGTATSRNDLLALKESLLATAGVKSIDLPINYLIPPTNNNFVITIHLDLE